MGSSLATIKRMSANLSVTDERGGYETLAWRRPIPTLPHGNL